MLPSKFNFTNIFYKNKIILFLVIFTIGIVKVQAAIITSARKGNFNVKSTWTENVIPTSADMVIINHEVTLSTTFTVGMNGTGGLTINTAGALLGTSYNLNGNGTKYTITNNGRLEVGGMDLNNSFTFINTGTALIKASNINWNSAGYISNQGSLTLSGNLNHNAANFINETSGIFTAGGNVTFNANLTPIKNKGNIKIAGDVILNAGSLENFTNSKITIGGRFTFNGSGILTNSGELTINSTDANNAFLVNSGSIFNATEGVINVPNGGLLQNGGNLITNQNLFWVKKYMLNAGSSLKNTGTFKVTNNFTNMGKVENLSCGRIEQLTQGFTLHNYNSPELMNDGFIKVAGNFTNDYLLKGTGVLHIYGTSTNNFNGKVSGTLCIKDFSKVNPLLIFDQNKNLTGIAPTVKTCATTAEPVACGLIKEEIPLPVTLISFTAKKNKNEIILEWSTAMEVNNEKFEVERSADGNIFKSIITVKGSGNSRTLQQYSTSDINPLPSISYYRLKQVDFDGTVAYSKIVAVEINKAGLSALSSVLIYPNPFQEKLNVSFTLPEANKLTFTLIDLLGKIIRYETLEGKAGHNEYTLKNLNTLSKGIYFLNLDAGKQHVSYKLIKKE